MSHSPHSCPWKCGVIGSPAGWGKDGTEGSLSCPAPCPRPVPTPLLPGQPRCLSDCVTSWPHDQLTVGSSFQALMGPAAPLGVSKGHSGTGCPGRAPPSHDLGTAPRVPPCPPHLQGLPNRPLTAPSSCLLLCGSSWPQIASPGSSPRHVAGVILVPADHGSPVPHFFLHRPGFQAGTWHRT